MKGFRGPSSESTMWGGGGRGSEDSGEAVGDFLLGSEEITLPKSVRGAQSAGGMGLGPLEKMPIRGNRLMGPRSAGTVGMGGFDQSTSPDISNSMSSRGGMASRELSRDNLRSSQSGRKGVTFVGLQDKGAGDFPQSPGNPGRTQSLGFMNKGIKLTSSFESEMSAESAYTPSSVLSPLASKMPPVWGSRPGSSLNELAPRPGSSWRDSFQDALKPYNSLPGGDVNGPPKPLSVTRLDTLPDVRASGSFKGVLPPPVGITSRPVIIEQPAAAAPAPEGDLFTQLNLLRERSWTEQQSLRRQLDDGRAEREELRKDAQAASVRAQELENENRRLRDGAMQAGDDQRMLNTIEEKNMQISQLENLLRWAPSPSSWPGECPCLRVCDVVSIECVASMRLGCRFPRLM